LAQAQPTAAISEGGILVQRKMPSKGKGTIGLTLNQFVLSGIAISGIISQRCEIGLWIK
jgi:hypothetical protein